MNKLFRFSCVPLALLMLCYVAFAADPAPQNKPQEQPTVAQHLQDISVTIVSKSPPCKQTAYRKRIADSESDGRASI